MSVLFDQLRISDNGQKLFIDAHVNEASYFDNMYIKKITVCTEGQVSEADMTTAPSKYIWQKQISGTSTREIHLMLTKADFDAAFINVSGIKDYVVSSEMPVTSIYNRPVSEYYDDEEDFYFSPLQSHIPCYFLSNSAEWADVQLITSNGYSTWGAEAGGFSRLYVSKEPVTSLGGFLIFQANGGLEPISYTATTTASESFNGSDLSHNMFFVYIECGGTPSANTPCCMDEATDIGATYDYRLIYNQGMNYTKELANTCEVSNNFLDFILNKDALEMALETEHWVAAIGFWKNLIGAGSSSAPGNNRCGCHG